MDWNDEWKNDKDLKDRILFFLQQYGKEGLERALEAYAADRKAYICKTRTAVFRIPIDDIFYLKINRHLISICTTAGIYEKYGSLTDEMKQLSSYHFIRCSQSCIVSLRKITGIQGSDIILANQERIRMSRALTPKVVAAFIMGRCG